jgi:hypothetical protein
MSQNATSSHPGHGGARSSLGLPKRDRALQHFLWAADFVSFGGATAYKLEITNCDFKWDDCHAASRAQVRSHDRDRKAPCKFVRLSVMGTARKRPRNTALAPLEIDQAIRLVRGQRVMLDADLAKLYEVTTRRLNEQVRRNKERFPDDFAFELTPQEFTNLMSQTATSKSHGGRRKLPLAFTEQGVAMLSSVLRSAAAVRVNVEIMRAFVRLRRLLATPGELVEQITRLADTVQLHDHQIRAISDVLRRMIEKPVADRPARRIGFHQPGAGGRK